MRANYLRSFLLKYYFWELFDTITKMSFNKLCKKVLTNFTQGHSRSKLHQILTGITRQCEQYQILTSKIKKIYLFNWNLHFWSCINCICIITLAPLFGWIFAKLISRPSLWHLGMDFFVVLCFCQLKCHSKIVASITSPNLRLDLGLNSEKSKKSYQYLKN